jgi:hypothetical protein
LPVDAASFVGAALSFVPDLLHEDISASSEKIVVRTSQTFICLNINQFLQIKILSDELYHGARQK